MNHKNYSKPSMKIFSNRRNNGVHFVVTITNRNVLMVVVNIERKIAQTTVIDVMHYKSIVSTTHQMIHMSIKSHLFHHLMELSTIILSIIPSSILYLSILQPIFSILAVFQIQTKTCKKNYNKPSQITVSRQTWKHDVSKIMFTVSRRRLTVNPSVSSPWTYSNKMIMEYNIMTIQHWIMS